MNSTSFFLFISLPAIVGNILLAVVLIPIAIYIGYRFGLSGYLEKEKQKNRAEYIKMAHNDGYSGREIKYPKDKQYVDSYNYGKWCREDDMLW